MSPEELALRKTQIALIASVRSQQELLLEELSQGNPQERLRLAQRLSALYEAHLQRHLEEIENLYPGLAAQLDYRHYPPHV